MRLPRSAAVSVALVIATALTGASAWAAGKRDSATVSAARLWESPDHTRAVFDLDRRVDYKLFNLEHPNRLVLDLPATALADGFKAPVGLGVVRSVRSGRPDGNTLRLVLDLGQDVRAKSFLLDPTSKTSHRLVLDLYPKDAEAAAVPVKSAESAAGHGGRKVIVAIDPGHGGEDPGASGPKGTNEKDVTMAISRALAAAIDAEPGMHAILMRDGDYFVSLTDRYVKARQANADLLVSVHADAVEGGGASGSSVYMLSSRGATSEAARMMADRENQSDLVGGVSLDDKDNTLAAVLLDLSQGASLSASDAVANRVLLALAKIGPLHKRDVQRANFVVLRSPDVPSILVETAFITNPTEERRLADRGEQKKLADAILDGVRDYFNAAPPAGTWFAENRQPVKEHIVSRGETLALIAQRHRVSIARLKDANPQQTAEDLKPGVVLKIPTSS